MKLSEIIARLKQYANLKKIRFSDNILKFTISIQGITKLGRTSEIYNIDIEYTIEFMFNKIISFTSIPPGNQSIFDFINGLKNNETRIEIDIKEV